MVFWHIIKPLTAVGIIHSFFYLRKILSSSEHNFAVIKNYNVQGSSNFPWKIFNKNDYTVIILPLYVRLFSVWC